MRLSAWVQMAAFALFTEWKGGIINYYSSLRFLMHKQHPQTAYRKYNGLIGTVFENCDRRTRIAVIKLVGGERCPFGQVPKIFGKFCATCRNEWVLLQNNVKCVTIKMR